MNPAELANRVLDSCGSTNDCARSLGEAGYPHGTWVSARRQEAGRGRLGRRWESQQGNLFLSMVARIEDKSLWTWIPLASAVAAAQAALELDPSIDVRLKWPNDLWVGGAKLGGILCEAVGNRDGSFIVIGIGLNCLQAPEGLDQRTACLGVPVDAARERLIAGLLRVLGAIRARGRAALAELVAFYEERAALPPGTAIEWRPRAPGEQDGVRMGVVEGLGLSGELLVRVAGREEPLKLFAEDVSVRSAGGG